MEIIKIDNIHSLILSGNQFPNLPTPFAEDIFLLDTHIAGTSFRKKLKELEPELIIDMELILKHEQINKYDSNAVAIYSNNDYKIGYIPQEENYILSNLLNAGKNLIAKITKKEWKSNWLLIEINVFMREV